MRVCAGDMLLRTVQGGCAHVGISRDARQASWISRWSDHDLAWDERRKAAARRLFVGTRCSRPGDQAAIVDRSFTKETKTSRKKK